MSEITSSSLEMSQWKYVQCCGPIELDTFWPNSSWMSAITMNAPLEAKRRAVASPIPLAPPVIIDIFPESFNASVVTAAIFVVK
ncbi:hypothetical protein CTI12_AA363450 [Artemisia annua]|uniref:Uncharacterized protein n=1 Tax=Artemisia annua TaxID=35608 RepID=A0A2U1MML1_ARTAN|nr:hypothetical protein CTI12_AA363450 [Artemisia annua]